MGGWLCVWRLGTALWPRRLSTFANAFCMERRGGGAALTRLRPVSGMGDQVWIHPVSRIAFADTQPPSDAWKRISKLAGIRARDARQTRRTYATLMLLAGAKPAFVSRQMAHANKPGIFQDVFEMLGFRG